MQNQGDLFQSLLSDFINKKYELVLLVVVIDWKHFENEFASFHSKVSHPLMPIRFQLVVK